MLQIMDSGVSTLFNLHFTKIKPAILKMSFSSKQKVQAAQVFACGYTQKSFLYAEEVNT